jgi:hypothetical protein
VGGAAATPSGAWASSRVLEPIEATLECNTPILIEAAFTRSTQGEPRRAGDSLPPGASSCSARNRLARLTADDQGH